MPAIKLITFDLDDTLWEINSVIQNAEQAVYQWLERHKPHITQRLSQQQLFEAKLEHAKRNPEFKHQISQLRQSFLAELLSKHGDSHDDAHNGSLSAYDIFMDYRHRVTFFDNAISTLQHLGEKYRLGIISNGNACSERLGIGQHFEFHLTAESVNASKPSPIPFQSALDKAEVQPEQCIHIGDNPLDDIKGAAELGIHTIWVNQNGQPWEDSLVAPSAEVTEISQVPEAVTRIAGQI